MKIFIYILAMALPIFAKSAEVISSSKLPDAPTVNYKSMGVFEKKTVIEFKGQPIHLTESTYLAADKVILSTQVITNGHELKIDTKELVFNKAQNGSIIGFAEPAAYGSKGYSGKLAARGTQGGDGRKGQLGTHGNKSPGSIIIFAEKIRGKIKIIANGEQGGAGGVGGDGAQGGKGHNGRNAETNCAGKDRKGKDGGRGAMGGLGGPGGDGGNGGAPVPVILITNDNQPMVLKGIISTPGKAGEAGKPGFPGPPGEGGDGGLPDQSDCGWPEGVDTTKGGQKGPTGYIRKGPKYKENLGYGNQGQAAGDIVYYPNFLKDFKDIDKHQMDKLWVEAVKPRLSKRKKPTSSSFIIDNFTESNKKRDDLNDKNTKNLDSLIGIVDFFKVKKNVFYISLAGYEQKRKNIYDDWLDFHFQRNFAFLIHSTLFEASSTNFINQEINTETLSMVKSDEEINRLNLISAWEEEFINPISDALSGTGLAQKSVHQLVKYKDNAKKMIKLLENKNIAEKEQLLMALKTLQSDIKEQLQLSLDKAADRCISFVKSKSEFSKYISKFTSHFTVPICEQELDPYKKEDLYAPIKLFARHEIRFFPSFVGQYVVRPTETVGSVFINKLLNILIPKLHANSLVDLDIPLMDMKKYTLLGLSVDEGANQKKSLKNLSKTILRNLR